MKTDAPPAPRALVVEDDSSWQQILTENLGDAGLEVDVAGSLEEAQALLRESAHRVAVVDLSLHGNDPHNQDGLRVLEAVRLVDPGCQAILLTGFATVELAVSVLTDYKALSCLRKEAFQRSQFRDLVRQALSSAPVSISPPESEAVSLLVSQSQVVPFGQALVVDDDAGWRGILSELLADAGFKVQLCRGFGEALGYLRREKFRLAVVDLSLSSGAELEGYRLLDNTRAAGIPTIVVSGVGNLNEIERAYSEQGIFFYMEKQAFDRRAFTQAVAAVRDSGQGASELDVLTEREREVLDLLAQGKTNREIAGALVISENTVKRHLKAIFRKLDIHTRSAAVAKAASEE